MITIRKLIAGFLFLLVFLVVQRMARGQSGQSASQTGTAQTQPQAAGFDAPAGFDGAVSFDNPVVFGPEASGLISSAVLGFMLGAAIVVAQRLRRRLFPASVRTIVLDL